MKPNVAARPDHGRGKRDRSRQPTVNAFRRTCRRRNDTYGHAVGDTVLGGGRGLRALRGSDVIGRLGGEEFGILLPHTRLDQAMGVLESVDRNTASTPAGRPYCSTR
ncbi:GGDEF domain-containing protein [Bradyrhizobium sp. B120]|uniref:GGDEF domain-containing protein n=1 Tax=Bradyrhizobium sp. B120 TaxID=3410088 RepID=UPI003B985F91